MIATPNLQPNPASSIEIEALANVMAIICRCIARGAPRELVSTRSAVEGDAAAEHARIAGERCRRLMKETD